MAFQRKLMTFFEIDDASRVLRLVRRRATVVMQDLDLTRNFNRRDP
jgi:hypothetical protein